MSKKQHIFFIAFAFAVFVILFDSCGKEKPFVTTPYAFLNETGYPKPVEPAYNKTTVEGVELGRHLFYDKRLSADNTQSCATCHIQERAFTDINKFSVGISGAQGNRQSMPLMNLAYNPFQLFFWDGRSPTLEDQVLHPVINPIEMANTWPVVIERLKADDNYVRMFEAAFGSVTIDSSRAAKALAQFVRSLTSFNSKFDKWKRGQAMLDSTEQSGLFIIQDLTKGDCFHCHNAEDKLFCNYKMMNNGLDLDADWTDMGYFLVTGNPEDKAKFKVPSLRNVMVTAPYMHDGRFATIDQVLIDHYLTGGKISTTIDPLMQFQGVGLNLSPNDIEAVKKFLHTLTDSTFLTNPAHGSPF